MDSWLNYLMHVSLTFCLFYCLYRFMLQNNSFLLLRRIYLLSNLVLAFLLPLIHIQFAVKSPVVYSMRPILWLISSPGAPEPLTDTAGDSSFHFTLFLIYAAPAVILLGLFFLRLFRIFTIGSEKSSLLSDRVILKISLSVTAPFSFLNRIYLNPVYVKRSRSRCIILHETGHIKEMHTLDILIAELAAVVLWFNPFIWLYRSTLREIHELLADRYALSHGVDLETYVEEIIGHAGLKNSRSFRIVHGFSGRIKRRINMMTQRQSAPHKRFCFLLIFPLVLLALFFFRAAQAHDSGVNFSNPVRHGHVSSRYGDRIHPLTGKKMFHRGIDIAADKGESVYAAAPGIVIETGYNKTSGNYIIIAHADSFSTFYSQISEILVKNNDKVNNRTLIGLVGSTGLSTGPHLHFELRSGTSFIDPELKIDFSTLKK